jgi:hypothetical protein
MRNRIPAGPAKMKKKFKGYSGWNYHPTKGFRRDSGYASRYAYNNAVGRLSSIPLWLHGGL